jgi:hypothetical protein
MTAAIEDKWHLYAMDLPEGGPIATSFTFETPTAILLMANRSCKPTSVSLTNSSAWISAAQRYHGVQAEDYVNELRLQSVAL